MGVIPNRLRARMTEWVPNLDRLESRVTVVGNCPECGWTEREEAILHKDEVAFAKGSLHKMVRTKYEEAVRTLIQRHNQENQDICQVEEV